MTPKKYWSGGDYDCGWIEIEPDAEDLENWTCFITYDDYQKLQQELDAAREVLEKIAEAERIGYGTQRTYGEMAIQAIEKLKG